MACLDHECTNPECDWWDGSNEYVDTCPLCGSHVVSHYDEADDFRADERYDDDCPSLLGAN